MDGVIQAPGASREDRAQGFKYGGWTGPYFDKDQDLGREMEKQMKGEYDLLLGRKTCDIFAGYWPDHSQEWPQVNRITKYVVSKTLTDPAWKNSVVLKDINSIKKLKNSPGPYLQVYGSGNLVQSLMSAGLVDEFWLKIFPLTLGTGKKLFDQGTVPVSFSLIDSRITRDGVIIASYQRSGTLKPG